MPGGSDTDEYRRGSDTGEHRRGSHTDEHRRGSHMDEYRRPESVLVVIHTARLECLLLERVLPAGFWQSVTGSLQWGETPAEAAAREVIEETGLDPTGLRDARVARRFEILPAWQRKFAPGVRENVEHAFYLDVPRPIAVRLNPDEHAAYAWLSLDDAIARVGSWTNREALEALRAG